MCIQQQWSSYLLRIVLKQKWCAVMRHHLYSIFGFYMLNHKWHIPVERKRKEKIKVLKLLYLCWWIHVYTNCIRHVMCLRHSMFIKTSKCILSITKRTVCTYIHVWAVLAVKPNRQEHHIQKHALGNDYYNLDVLAKIYFSLQFTTSRKSFSVK